MTLDPTQRAQGSQFTARERVVLAPVAPERLVAWYPFRSGTGEDITAGSVQFGDSTDYSATVNGATYKPNGGVTDIQTGANSGAFDLDGTDDTLDLGTVADSDQSLTFMTWVNPDTVTRSSRNFRVVTKVDGGTFSDGSIAIDILNTGEPRAFAINGTTITVTDSTTLSTNQFVHLASRYNFETGELSLFRDGQLVGTDSVGQLPSFSSQPWRVGLDNPIGANDKRLDGTVDGTRIYTAALSDSQINQIYLNTKP